MTRPNSGHLLDGRKLSTWGIVQFGIGQRSGFEYIAASKQYLSVGKQGRRTSDFPPRLSRSRIESMRSSGHLAGNTERAGTRIIEFGGGLRSDQDLSIG